MTKYIGILNPKGGVTKSTTAINLAMAFHLAGHKTAIVDTDSQGSVRDWASINPDNPIDVLGMDTPDTIRRIKSFTENYDIVIIDGAAKTPEMVGPSVAVSDIVLMTLTPSHLDVWGVTGLFDLVQGRLEAVGTNNFQAGFIIGAVREGTKLSLEILDALQDLNQQATTFAEVPVVGKVGLRQCYIEMLENGETVYETKSPKAAEEIDQIYHRLIEAINGEKPLNVPRLGEVLSK